MAKKKKNKERKRKYLCQCIECEKEFWHEDPTKVLCDSECGNKFLDKVKPGWQN